MTAKKKIATLLVAIVVLAGLIGLAVLVRNIDLVGFLRELHGG